VPPGSPVSPILFAIDTADQTILVEKSDQPEGIPFVDGLGWVATRKDVNQVVQNVEACGAESIEWASR